MSIQNEMTRLTPTERLYARRVSDYLAKQHEKHGSNISLDSIPDSERNYRGTCGEIFFENWKGAGYQFKPNKNGRGDGHIDSEYLGRTVDVKALNVTDAASINDAVSRLNLLIKEGETVADMYVAILYADDGYCSLFGYATRDQVLSVSPRCWPYVISNHVIPLKQMELLL